VQALLSVSYSTHAAVAGRRRGIFRGNVGDHRLGGDQKRSDRAGILQGGPHDLGGIDDAGRDHVDIGFGLGIKALVGVLAVGELADHDRAFDACILGDLPDRCLERPPHDRNACGDISIVTCQSNQHSPGTQQRHAAAGNDAFLDSRAGGVQRVVYAVLLLFGLGLRHATNTDDSDAAGEFGQPLLQLLLVVVGSRFLDLRLDLADARRDAWLVAGAVDDCRGILLDHDALGTAEHVERDILQLDAEILGDYLAGGQHRDVLEHGFAAVSEAGSLDGRYLEATTQLVDDQRGERLALDVFGDNQQRLSALHHSFQYGQHGLQIAKPLLMNEDVRVIQFHAHLLGIGHKVGRGIAAIELHALDHVELSLGRLGFLDGDDAFVADLVHRPRNHLAHGRVAVSRDRADLG